MNFLQGDLPEGPKLLVLKHMNLLALIRLSQTSTEFKTFVRSDLVWFPRYKALSQQLGERVPPRFRWGSDYYNRFMLLWTDTVKYTRRADNTIMFYQILDQYHGDETVSSSLFHVSLSKGSVQIIENDSPFKDEPVYAQFPGMLNTMVDLNGDGQSIPFDYDEINFIFRSNVFDDFKREWDERSPDIALSSGTIAAILTSHIAIWNAHNSWAALGDILFRNAGVWQTVLNDLHTWGSTIANPLVFVVPAAIIGAATVTTTLAIRNFLVGAYPHLFKALTQIDYIQVVNPVSDELGQIDLMLTDGPNTTILSVDRIYRNRVSKPKPKPYEIMGPNDPMMEERMFMCSLCTLPMCGDCTESFPEHKSHCEVVTLLETATKDNIVDAVDRLRQYYDPEGPKIGVIFDDCPESDTIAKANSKRIIVCDRARVKDFQDDPSKGVPNYDEKYNVKHLTVVMLHEAGHVLDKRHALSDDMVGKGDDEARANAFVKHFLSK